MEYRKNDEIELQITDLGTEGEGIGKTGAFTWFIKDAIPGDKIKAVVTKVGKTYGFARLKEITVPGADRIKPACQIAKRCGGCVLQEMNYASQLKFKENKVKNALERIGGFRLDEGETEFFPVIGMENPFRYRNKAQVPVGKNRNGKCVAGFYAGRTHCIVPCDDCLLGPEENRDILKTVLFFMDEYHIDPYDEESHAGLVRHVLIRKGFSTGEIMVCLVINGRKLPYADTLCERLSRFPGMKTVVLNINTDRTNVILGKETAVLSGPGYIEDLLGGIRFRISAQSFYQVNPVQTEKLYGKAAEYAALTGKETVWDLYCGIGTISLFLSKMAEKVCGVEIVPQAIDDARENADRNGIKNVRFFTGKAEEVLPEQVEKNKARADVIVVDPPRKGCDGRCLETMLQMRPERIVYVSCDPATLARDLKILCADGTYGLKKVQPVDLFPQTGHVETVVLMSRVEGK